MKTFTRMIGRYVLATAAVVLLVVGLLLGAVVYLGLHYGEAAARWQRPCPLPPTACSWTPPARPRTGCRATPGRWHWTTTAV